jgi:hypothetical protein
MALAKPLVAVAAALAAASPALAAGPIVRHNATDQAAARAAVLKASDLGTGWTGSVKTVAKPEPLSCPPSFVPRQDDLVVTGEVESSFQKQGVAIGSDVALFQTAQMVRNDWSRTFRPQVSSCLASVYRKGAVSGQRLVSVRKVPFPLVAPLVAAYRVSSTVTQQGQTIPLALDLVFVGKGRSEILLTFFYPQQAQETIVAAERRIAALVVRRIRG